MQGLDSRNVVATSSQQGLHSLQDDRAIPGHEIRDVLRLLSQAMSLEESPKVRIEPKTVMVASLSFRTAYPDLVPSGAHWSHDCLERRPSSSGWYVYGQVAESC